MIRVAIALTLVIAASHAGAASYCMLDRQGRDAIPRQGFCPAGYRSEGDCCRAFHADTKKAFPKLIGKACPSGSYVSGGSCVSLR